MNITKLDEDLSVSPQITPADIDRIRALGFRSILAVRPDAEELGQPSAADIKAAAEASGLEMVYLPVSGMPTGQDVDKLSSLWPDLSKPCLGYCRSGARAAMLWDLYHSTE